MNAQTSMNVEPRDYPQLAALLGQKDNLRWQRYELGNRAAQLHRDGASESEQAACLAERDRLDAQEDELGEKLHTMYTRIEKEIAEVNTKASQLFDVAITADVVRQRLHLRNVVVNETKAFVDERNGKNPHFERMAFLNAAHRLMTALRDGGMHAIPFASDEKLYPDEHGRYDGLPVSARAHLEAIARAYGYHARHSVPANSRYYFSYRETPCLYVSAEPEPDE